MNQKYLLLFLLLLCTTLAFGQNAIRPLHLIQEKKAQGVEFKENNLLEIANTTRTVEGLVKENATHTVLSMNELELSKILEDEPEALTLLLPYNDEIIEVYLAKVNPFSDDFSVVDSKTERPIDVELGVHYRGVFKNDKTSIASLSVFNEELIGLFSANQYGNLVLGKLTGDNWTEEHVIYHDANIMDDLPFECGTPDDGVGYTREELEHNDGRALSDCVRFYFEVDDDITSDKGGTTGVTNFVTGMYNQVAAIYDNENINTVISEIFIWTTDSPYGSNSSSVMLSQFQNFRENWNGDLAQLLSYQASGGIAAGFNGICNPNEDASMTFSSINPNYNDFPVYSWNIMVISHEFGHVFGSRHTHACVWNGNNTAIDGCSGSTEGSCSLPGIPSQGGTIMSYCHLQSVGINFNEGFGPQPGDVIRNEVDGGDCLVPCGPPTCDDGVQNGDETGVDCGGPDCPACPTCDDGIQNGDETGVDCGGSICAPCPCFDNELTLTIVLDNYPEETTWDVKDDTGNVIASGGAYGAQPDGSTVVENLCVPNGCFDFTIYDSFGDGICCDYGIGSYSLVENATGNVLASGGQFGSQEVTNFCSDQGDDPSDPKCTDVTLDIQLDANPSQTTWELVDNQGTVLFSGGPYSDENGVVNETFCLEDGCFNFTIYDSGSNGLCCRAGVGEYTLTNQSTGDILANGSAFDALESTDFCINDAPADPTCDDGVQNGDEEGVDCGGSNCPPCDSCNDGVQNGDEEGVDCGGSNCPPCDSCNDGVQNGDEEGVDCGGPDCPACPTCNDGIQNGDEEGVDCGGPDCPACDDDADCDNLVNSSDFEGGFGIWIDGGSDCRRSAADAAYANSGTFCIRIRDNSSSSTLTTIGLDLSAYNQIEVDFTYITRSMESGEDFWLQISTDDGDTYTTIEDWISGVDFDNEVRKFETVIINGPFSADTRVRFRCDALNNSDYVYLDDIVISGCGSNNLVNTGTTTKNPGVALEGATVHNPISAVNLFPNPTRNELNVRFNVAIATEAQLVVTDLNGKTLQVNQFFAEEGAQEQRLDVTNLEAGIYFLYLHTGKERIARKFVVTK